MSWNTLLAELDAWRRRGAVVELWWRDDDAEHPGAALRRLMHLSEAHQVPIAIAVPPALTTTSLAHAVGAEFQCTVLQHGYAHINHAPAGEKKCELGDHRPIASITRELEAGRARLQDLFGTNLLSVQVPPWNRISPAVLAELHRLGFVGVSGYTPRERRVDCGLLRCNTHVDIINWRERRFVGTDAAVELLTLHLSMKRVNGADPAEPTGVLTHHLKHDAGCWAFLDQLLARTAEHPTVRWLPATRVFAGAGVD